MRPCPHCGDNENGFVVNSEMRGHCESIYNQEGEYVELFTDKTYAKRGKTVRCGKCGKIRRDLRVDGGLNVRAAAARSESE